MAATPVAATTKYIHPATTVVVWAPSIANKAAPTRAEINAGTSLVDENSACEGWNTAAGSVPIPNMGSRFTGSIPGRITADESSLSTYADIGGADPRTLMPEGTNGFVIWMDGGDVAGRKMDVFPVRVASVAKSNRSVEGEEAAQLMFSYSITSAPAVDVIIPA